MSVVLRLFEGVSELVLRLFEDPLEGYFEVVLSVVLSMVFGLF